MQPTADKIAIITGAGSGIGAGAARYLIEHGWRAVLFARSEQVEKVAAEFGEKAIAVRGDITQETDLRRLIDTALQHHSRIDGVVISTGYPPAGDLMSITDQDWQRGMELLLMPTIRLGRLLLPVFLRQRGGAMVAISTFGAVAPSSDYPVSSVCRSALSNYIHLFARQHAAQNIRINSVLPGFVENYPERTDVLQQIPLHRYATMSEMGAAIAFLLSAEASYITGQNLRVDGGLVNAL